jgi:hypothetical protein
LYICRKNYINGYISVPIISLAVAFQFLLATYGIWFSVEKNENFLLLIYTFYGFL